MLYSLGLFPHRETVELNVPNLTMMLTKINIKITKETFLFKLCMLMSSFSF